MNMTSNPLWPTLDRFHVDLPSRGAHLAIGQLAASLADHRRELPFEVWKTSCATLDDHPAVAQLLEDPYSRDARTKPAGYAGDARTLDYVYLQDPGAQAMTPAGRAIFEVSTNVPIAVAVRQRCTALADAIARRAAGRSMTVASIACGHARELDRLSEDVRERVRFWGMDQDAASISHCRSRFGTSAMFEVGSVRDIIAGRVRIPHADLIYASGLFDYLDQRAASVLVKRMVASLNDGGSVIVPNLTPQNEEVGYMEAVMDWWMCYRTESEMRQLADLLDPARFRATTTLRSHDRMAWLEIERLP